MDILTLAWMIGIVGVWLVLFLVFSGIGISIRRFFGLEITDIETLLTDFWLGWAAGIVFLQIWHLFIKVDWRAFLIIAAAGAVGLLKNGRAVWQPIKNYARISRVYYFSLLVTALWLARRAMSAPTIYDTGLYYLPSIRWITSFAIVPGLGNLSGYLAFNSSFFLYVAAVVSVLGRESYCLANGILVLTLGAQILLSYNRLFKEGGCSTAGDIFYALLLGPVLYLVFYINVSNPSPDIPVFILGILLAAQLIALFEKKPPSRSENGYRMFCAAILAAIGIALKQGFFVVGSVTILLLFASIRQHRTVKNVPLLCLGAISAVLIFWLIRGVILSGYLVFPVPLGSFPVAWRVPYANALNMARSISFWARIPFAKGCHGTLSNWNWFLPWLIRIFHNPGMVACIIWVLAGCVLLLFYRLSGKHKNAPGRIIAIFLLPWLMYLPVWFFIVPNPRYLSSSLCIVGAGLFTIAFNNYGLIKDKIKFRGILTIYIIVCSLFFLIKAGDHRVVRMGSCAGFKVFSTDSGLLIYIPEEGDQCWDAPLPCAPAPVKNLRLRKENIRGGFIGRL